MGPKWQKLKCCTFVELTEATSVVDTDNQSVGKSRNYCSYQIVCSVNLQFGTSVIC